MNILKLIDRNETLFIEDIEKHNQSIKLLIESSSFLVIGGAGSIGQAVTKEIFKRNPKKLHVIDINENNLVELVRDLRSSIGYIEGDFRTFAIDCGGNEFQALVNNNDAYDYVLNLSALKHVRSEKDPYTLMRLIQVNILNTIKTIQITKEKGAKKYFCVSTDKAANPVNMMGASKRIMEMFLMRESESLDISTARFANVAFSDGSLLHGFNQRFAKRQPISAPDDIRRYFVTPQESGELCLMSCLFGENRDIFFPKLSEKLHLITFSKIAERYLRQLGYEPYHCSTEQEARDRSDELITAKKWPCYFFKSDTSGEKDFEEFFTEKEKLELGLYNNIGVIKNAANYNNEDLKKFLDELEIIRSSKVWKKNSIVQLFNSIIKDFNHKETGKYLDGRM
tara:strand:+ start:336 stop:1523 length:1188 start_codon:yes stop_codon:yes gene_type:complete